MNQNLTKTCLFSLSTGVHLVSNTHHSIGVPVFAETVSPVREREQQWRRIVVAKANGRHFFLFATAEGYKQMIERMGYGQLLSAAYN